jgi:hypothetical protein
LKLGKPKTGKTSKPFVLGAVATGAPAANVNVTAFENEEKPVLAAGPPPPIKAPVNNTNEFEFEENQAQPAAEAPPPGGIALTPVPESDDEDKSVGLLSRVATPVVASRPATPTALPEPVAQPQPVVQPQPVAQLIPEPVAQPQPVAPAQPAVTAVEDELDLGNLGDVNFASLVPAPAPGGPVVAAKPKTAAKPKPSGKPKGKFTLVKTKGPENDE